MHDQPNPNGVCPLKIISITFKALDCDGCFSYVVCFLLNTSFIILF